MATRLSPLPTPASTPREGRSPSPSWAPRTASPLVQHPLDTWPPRYSTHTPTNGHHHTHKRRPSSSLRVSSTTPDSALSGPILTRRQSRSALGHTPSVKLNLRPSAEKHSQTLVMRSEVLTQKLAALTKEARSVNESAARVLAHFELDADKSKDDDASSITSITSVNASQSRIGRSRSSTLASGSGSGSGRDSSLSWKDGSQQPGLGKLNDLRFEALSKSLSMVFEDGRRRRSNSVLSSASSPTGGPGGLQRSSTWTPSEHGSLMESEYEDDASSDFSYRRNS